MPPFRRALILALFLLSLGGAMLHVRIHPLYEAPEAAPVAAGEPPGPPGEPEFQVEHLFAWVISLVDVVVVTALFCSIRTVSVAYLLNGMFVIFGTVFMAHVGIVDLLHKFKEPTLFQWVFQTTLSDIFVLWVDFFIGKAIYDSYTLTAPA